MDNNSPHKLNIEASVLKVSKIVGVLTLILIIANFSFQGWDWGVVDFIAAALLLFVAGVAIDITLQKFSNRKTKLLAIGGIIFLFCLVWAELAVDLISDDMIQFLNK